MVRTPKIAALFALAVAGSIASQAGADDVTLDGMTSKTPASWKAGKLDNKFRVHQFTVPRAEGDDADAELVIFFFGPGGGGGVAENLKRWKQTFEAPAGKSIDDVSKVETLELPKAKLTYLDVSGTLLDKFPPFAPNAKTIRKPDHRRLAVVFDSENGPYFIRLTGPAKTIAAVKPEFDAWLKNFK